MANETAATGDAMQSKQVGIQRIYLKDSSFEAPGTPAVFTQEWKPKINLNLSTANRKMDVEVEPGAEDPGDVYEVTLTVEARAMLGDNTAFLCEVKQSGLFFLKGLSAEELTQVLGSFCPSQLYPYAREAISDLVGKGGFPSLALQPVNFDGMLAESQRKAAEGAH